MFIYNVTINVSWNVHEEWLAWMKLQHMPALLATNCFAGYKLLKLHGHDETEGPTYVAQYFAESKALYNRYIDVYANNFRKEIAEKWSENIFTFRTLLEEIE